MLLQIHRLLEGGHRKLVTQREINNEEELKKLITEIETKYPTGYLICDDKSGNLLAVGTFVEAKEFSDLHLKPIGVSFDSTGD